MRTVVRALVAGALISAVLVMLPAPAHAVAPDNDNFSDAVAITGTEGTSSGSTIDATSEPGEPEHASVGSNSVWFSWTAPDTGLATFDTFGSGFDTVLAVYTGTSVDELSPVAANDDTGGLQSQVSFVTEGITYAVAVSGWNGATGNYDLNWTFDPEGGAPPNDNFADAQVIEGATGQVGGTNVVATMEPGEPAHDANGVASVWYRWTSPVDGGARFETDGSAFDTVLAVYTGESVDSLTLVAANDDVQFPQFLFSRVTFRAARDTTYFVAVAGWPSSEGDIALTWRSADSAPNDFFADAQVIEGASGTVPGSNAGAIDEPPDEPHHSRGEDSSVWYRWTAPVTDAFAFDTFGSTFNSVLAVYTGQALGDLEAVVVNDDTGGLQSRVGFVAQEGVAYSIAVASGSTDTGDLTLSWAPIDPGARPANDDFANAQALSSPSGSVDGSNVGATRETGEPGHPELETASVWYAWTAPADGVMAFDTDGSGFEADLVVYTGDQLDNLTRAAPRGVFDAVAGTTYRVVITGGGATGSIVLNWHFDAAPANDDFAAASVLTGAEGSIAGSNVGATLEPGEPDHHHNFHGSEHSVWYSWTAPASGLAFFDVVDRTFDSGLIAAYTGTALDDLEVVGFDSYGSEETLGVTIRVDAGVTYRIAVASNWDNGGFRLDWQLFEPVANDNLSEAITLPAAGSISAANLDATVEPGEPAHLGTGGSSVWYRWTAASETPVTFETSGSLFDTVIAVYRGTSISDLTLVAQSDDADTFDDWSQLRFAPDAGTTYFVVVDGAFGAQGVFRLHWYPAPANDDFAERELITGASGTVAGTNRGAAVERGQPLIGEATVWYRWVAPNDGTHVFTVSGADNHVITAAYTGSVLNELVEVANGESFGESERAGALRIDATAGTEYAIGVGAKGSLTPRFGGFELSWGGPLPGDAFADAVELTGNDVLIEATTVGASREDGEPEHARGDGPSVWYRWTAPADGGVIVGTTDTDNFFDTALGIYTGNAVDALDPVTSNDDGPSRCCGTKSLARFTAVAGTEYRIAVAGGPATSFGRFVLRLQLVPPPANDAFDNAAVLTGWEGGVTRRTVGATEEPGEPVHADEGEASVWYEWAAPADGAVAFTTAGSDFDTVLAVYEGIDVADLVPVVSNIDVNFQRANITSRVSFIVEGGRTYRIAVSGGRFGRMGDLSLAWERTTAAEHDDFADARLLSGERGDLDDTNDAADVEPGEPLHAGVATTSVWYRWTAPADGVVRFLAGAPFDDAIAVYTGTAVDDLDLVASNDDNRLGQAEVTFRAMAGTSYAIAVGGVGDATGGITLRWEPVSPPANDDFGAAAIIDGPSGEVAGQNLAATTEMGEPAHAGSGGSSIWYRWTAPASGRFVFDTLESRFDLDTVLGIYTGNAVDALTVVAANDDAAGTLKSVVELDAVAGTTYHIAVDGFGGGAGPVVLRWTDPPANDTFSSPTVITGRIGELPDDNLAASTEPDEPDDDGRDAATGASIWYEWVAPYSGPVQFAAERNLASPASYFDVVTAVYTGDSVDGLTRVAQSGELPFGIVTFEASEGTVYRIAVSGRRAGDGPAATGTFQLTWFGPPANDAFADAEAIGGTSGSATGRTVAASGEDDEPLHLGIAGGSVWYRWTAPYRGVVTFDTLGTFEHNRQGVGNSGRWYDTVLAVYRGDAVDELTLIAQNNDHAPEQLDSRLSFHAERGETFYIAVSSWGAGEFLLHWNEEVLPPANDDVAAAAVVEGRTGSVDGTLIAATAEEGEPDHGGAGTSVWYEWTAPFEGTVTFDAGDGTAVRAYTGDLAAAVRTGNPRSSAFGFHASAGTTYLIAIDATDAPRDFVLSWSTPIPPNSKP